MTTTDENPPPPAPAPVPMPAPAFAPGAPDRPDYRRLILPLAWAVLVFVVVLLTPLEGQGLDRGLLRWAHVQDAGPMRGLFIAASVLSIGAVLICRWQRWWGLVLACLPFLLVLLSGRFVWGWLLALIAVAAIAGVDRWRSAILPWAAAMVVGIGYCASGVPALLPGGLVYIRIRKFDYPTYGVAPIDWSRLVGYLGAYLLLITAPVVLAVAAGLIRDAMRQRREAAASERRAFQVESAASERARLARDLHDVVAHHLSLVAVRAESAPFTHPGIGDDAREVLAAIAADARSALDELRQVLRVLRPAAGDQLERAPQPGAGEIPGLVQQAADSGQRVTVSGDGWSGIPPAAGYVLYRAVQEALTNARRHAPGEPVEVLIVRSDRAIMLRASNRVRPGEPVGEDGRGLIGMRERVTALRGSVSTGVTHDVFALTVTVPLREDEPVPDASAALGESASSGEARTAEMAPGPVITGTSGAPGESGGTDGAARTERSRGTVIPDEPGDAEGAADDGKGGR